MESNISKLSAGTAALAATAQVPLDQAPGNRFRVAALAALASLLASVLLLAAAGSANAGYTGAGGETAASSVSCNYHTREMNVAAITSQMWNDPRLVSGQYVRYRVYTRNATANSGWYLQLNWSAWIWVDARNYSSQAFQSDIWAKGTRKLGDNLMWGVRHNSFQVGIQYEHYNHFTGTSVVQWDGSPTYWHTYGDLRTNPTSCVF